MNFQEAESKYFELKGRLNSGKLTAEQFRAEVGELRIQDEEGRYWLKTPVEQGLIQVDDVPFVAVELRTTGSGDRTTLEFRSNIDEWVTAGADHPIRVEHDRESGEPTPYIRLRDELDALILRPVFYELAELAVPEERNGRTVLGVWSAGRFFELGEL